MEQIILAIVFLSIVGAASAMLLYIASRKFQVHENPHIAQIEEVLPSANCGGCGYPGCKGFAEACATAETLDGLSCPVGGKEVMAQVATILGKTAQEIASQIAVVRCNGSCENRTVNNVYDGATSCAVAAMLYGGETGCSYGCLELGDCVSSCLFDAIHINTETGLPEVIREACTSCGICVEACPKNIIELRKISPESGQVYVSCVNKDKGAVARKACSVACIACGKCQKACVFGAITIENNVAYIQSDTCTLCKKCVDECPTKAITSI